MLNKDKKEVTINEKRWALYLWHFKRTIGKC